MKYIIEGRDVEVVLRENAIRIKRGDLVVTPYAEAHPAGADSKDVKSADSKAAPVADEKEVTANADSKDVNPADEKAPAVSKAKKSTGNAKK